MATKATLADLISSPTLEELAGDRSFERGLAYFRNGAVERLVSQGDRISARVVGTDVYTIKLWPDGRRLGWNCTCPVGQDGEFCKTSLPRGSPGWLRVREPKNRRRLKSTPSARSWKRATRRFWWTCSPNGPVRTRSRPHDFSSPHSARTFPTPASSRK